MAGRPTRATLRFKINSDRLRTSKVRETELSLPFKIKLGCRDNKTSLLILVVITNSCKKKIAKIAKSSVAYSKRSERAKDKGKILKIISRIGKSKLSIATALKSKSASNSPVNSKGRPPSSQVLNTNVEIKRYYSLFIILLCIKLIKELYPIYFIVTKINY